MQSIDLYIIIHPIALKMNWSSEKKGDQETESLISLTFRFFHGKPYLLESYCKNYAVDKQK